MAGFVLAHLMDGVMDGVEVLGFGELCDAELVLACACLGLNSLFEVGLGVPYYFAEKLCKP